MVRYDGRVKQEGRSRTKERERGKGRKRGVLCEKEALERAHLLCAADSCYVHADDVTHARSGA